MSPEQVPLGIAEACIFARLSVNQPTLPVTEMLCVLAITWFYSTVIGCIPLATDDAYTYLGSARLRICFIDLTATSGGSTFAALLLCAVVAPSLVAVSVCYFQIFVAARVQAQRIYDIELAAAAAGRRVSSSSTR